MSSLRRTGLATVKKPRSTRRGPIQPRLYAIGLTEELEQRIAPAVHLLGGLEFLTADPTFTPTSKVQIGKDPGAGTFFPLMEVSGGFSYDDANTKFTTGGTVSAIVGPSVIPLFNGTRTFAVPDFLTNIGAAVSNSLGMTAAQVNFSLTNVQITSNALKLQGSISLPNVSNFTVAVKGSDYVVIDSTGVKLTGLNASIPNGTSFGVGGLTFTTQNVNVAYTSANDAFALTGTAGFSLSTGAGKPINAGVTLGDAGLGTKGLVVSNGALNSFDMAVTASVAVGTTTIATNPTGGLKVAYDTASSTFTMTGGATVSFGTGRSLALTMGGKAADNTPTPGLVIQNGTFKSLDATADINAQIAGVTFAGNGVRVAYVAASDSLSVSGAASFTTTNNQTLTFSSFSVVVAGGQLTSLSGTASVAGSIAGATINASNITASYVAASGPNPEQITASGSLTVKAKTNQTLAVTITNLSIRAGLLSSITGTATATGTIGGATFSANVTAFAYAAGTDTITATSSGSITTSGPKLDFTGLDLVITGGNLTSLTGSATASGTVAGTTLAANVKSFSYTSADDTLTALASGSITTTNGGPSLSFTDVNVVIVAGKLSSLTGTMSASGKVAGASFSATALNVAYVASPEKITVSGTATVNFGTGRTFTLGLGSKLPDNSTSAGLTIAGGVLTQLDALGTTPTTVTIAGASLSTTGVRVVYQAAVGAVPDRLAVTGDVTVAFGTGRTLTVGLGSKLPDNTTSAGLIISGGALQQLDALVTAPSGIAVAGTTITTTGLRVQYQSAGDTLAVTGTASIAFGSGRSFTLGLGSKLPDNTTSAGLLISGGKLSQVDALATTPGLTIAGATVTSTNGLHVLYQSATDTLAVTGDASIAFGTGRNFSLTLGGKLADNTTSAGLLISGGTLQQVDALATTTSGITVAGATVTTAKGLHVLYQSATDTLAVTGDATIAFGTGRSFSLGLGNKLPDNTTSVGLLISGGKLTQLDALATTASGITVAGATVTTVNGLHVLYQSAGDTLAVTGDATVTFGTGRSFSLGLGSKLPDNTTSAGLIISGGALQQLDALATTTGLTVAGATVTSTNGLHVLYQSSTDTLAVTGDASVAFGTGRNFSLTLGGKLPDNTTSAGLLISAGKLQQLDALATTTSGITVAGATITTTNGLHVLYRQATDTLAITGDAAIAFGTGRNFALALGGKLPDNTTSAGLLISGGKLQQVDALATTSGLTIAGATVTSTNGLHVLYQSATDTLAVTGDASITFGSGRTFALALGSKLPDNSTSVGLLISGGSLQELDALATTSGISVAGTTLTSTKGLRIRYQSSVDTLTLSGEAAVSFGGGRSFTLGLGSKLPDNTTSAGLVIKAGALNQLDALATTTGIQIAGATFSTTGLRVTYQAAAGVTPEQLTVGGTATLAFGSGRSFTLGLGSKLPDNTTTAGLVISGGTLQQLDALATTSTGISVAGVTVGTTGLRIVYQAAGVNPELLAVSGNASVSFGTGRKFDLALGSKLPDGTTSAGLVISGGSLQKLDALATTTGITVAGATVSTTGLRLQYQAAAGTTPEQLAVTGTASIAFGSGRTFTLGLGSKLPDNSTTVGLLISGGALQQLDALVTTSSGITVAGATVTTTGLHVLYQSTADTLAITGDASVAFGTGRTFTLGLGSKLADGSTSTGLLISGGVLKQLDALATMSPSITIAGAKVTSAKGLRIQYAAASGTTPEQLAVTGDATVDFGSNRVVSIGLGSKLPDGSLTTGLLIRDGSLAALDATGSITNIKIAAATLNATNLRVVYQASPELLKVAGNATLDFGSNRRLELGLGTASSTGLPSDGLVIRDGTLFALDATASLTGMSFGGGTLNATDLHVVYQANPEQISVTGNLALTVASNTLNLVVNTFTIKDGSLKALNASLTSNITVAGLRITTKALKVNYLAADSTLTPARPETLDITGTATILVKQQSVSITLGQGGANGLLIQNNVVQKLDASLTSDLTVSALSFKTTGLRLTYQKAVQATNTPEQFTISGAASFQLQTNTVQVQFGDSKLGTQGLVLRNGVLTTLDMAVTGSLNVGGLSFDATNLRITYSTSSDPANDGLFTISGGSSVSVKNKFTLQVQFGDPTLQTKGLVIQNGDLKSMDIAVTTNASFTIAGLSIAPDSLRITYDAAAQTFTAGGAAHFTLKGSRIDVALGVPGKSQGLVIRDGDLQLLQMSVSTDKPFNLMGLSIGPKNLTVAYVAATASTPMRFSMYGSLTVSSGESGSKTFNSLTATMGTAAAPGIVISGGNLQSLNVGLSGSFNLYGLSIAPQSLIVKYSTSNNVDILTVSGGVSVALADTIKVDVAFPDNGLVINTTTGEVSVKNLNFMTSVNIGILKVRDLYFSYSTDAVTNVVSLSAGFRQFDIDNDDAGISLPGGVRLAGRFAFKGGAISSVALAMAGAKIPIGSTGFFLTGASGSIDHLEDPSNLVVTASLTISFGASVKFAGTNYSLLEATGSIQVSTSDLQLHGSVTLVGGVLGSGSIDLDLNWTTGIYSAHVNVSMYGGVFLVDGSFTFTSGGDVTILATAKVRIPDIVPFIGGTTLAGMGFYLQIRPKEDMSHSFAAAWISVDLFFFSATVGVKYDFDNNISIINGDDVGSFAKPSTKAPSSFTYTSPEFTIADPSRVASIGFTAQSDAINNASFGKGTQDSMYVMMYNDKSVLTDPNAYKDPSKLRVLTYKDFLWLQANGQPVPGNDKDPQVGSNLAVAVPNDVTVPDADHPNQRIISLSPVGKNVAMLGKVSQSSDAVGGVASRAVDGKTNGDWSQGSVTHTQDQTYSWWSDTLDRGYYLDQINLYNRTDVPKRLSNFTVYVYHNSSLVFSQSYFTAKDAYAPAQFSIPLGGIYGDTVKIQLNNKNNNGDGILSLAEVEIFAAPDNRSSLDFKYYQVLLQSTTSLAASPPTFTDTIKYRDPSVTLSVSSGATTNYQVDFTLMSGTSAYAPTNNSAKIGLYIDSDPWGYDGTLVGQMDVLSSTPTAMEGNHLLWKDLRSFAPNPYRYQEYFFYAVIDDGVNPPVRSLYTSPVFSENPNPTLTVRSGVIPTTPSVLPVTVDKQVTGAPDYVRTKVSLTAKYGTWQAQNGAVVSADGKTVTIDGANTATILTSQKYIPPTGTYPGYDIVDVAATNIFHTGTISNFTVKDQLTVYPSSNTDLVVTQVADNPNPAPGAAVNLTFTVKNRGSRNAGAATNVALNEVLPTGLTYVSSSAGRGAYDPDSGVWTIGDLAVGQSVTLTVAARVDDNASGLNLVSTAKATANQVVISPSEAIATTMIGVSGAIVVTTANDVTDTSAWLSTRRKQLDRMLLDQSINYPRQIADDNGQLVGLRAQLDPASTLSTRISTLRSRISANQTSLTDPSLTEAQKASLRSQILVDQNDVSALDEQRANYQADINRITADRDAVQSKLDALPNAISNLKALIAVTPVSFREAVATANALFGESEIHIAKTITDLTLPTTSPILVTAPIVIKPDAPTATTLHLNAGASLIASRQNLLLNATAVQSSTYVNHPASLAVDGNTDGRFDLGSVATTGNGLNSFWKATLTEPHVLSSVQIFGGTDFADPKRLSNFRLTVFNGTAEAYHQDFFTTPNTFAPLPWPLNVDLPRGIVGDSVQIQLLGKNNVGDGYLPIAEVKLFTPPAKMTLDGFTLDLSANDAIQVQNGSAAVFRNDRILVTGRGGYLIDNYGTMTFAGSTIEHNSSFGDNAGSKLILNTGTLDFNAGSIQNIQIPLIQNGGTLNLTNATFANDFGSFTPGTPMIVNTGTAKLLDVTVGATSALLFNRPAMGGAVISNQGGRLTIVDSSFDYNYSTSPIVDNSVGTGSVDIQGTAIGATTFSQTGVVLTRTASVVKGPFRSGGRNFIATTDGSTGWVASDLTGTLASRIATGLGTLANNGGSMLTMLPGAGSKLVDAGFATTSETVDQLGNPRVVNGLSDIGALEVPFGTKATVKLVDVPKQAAPDATIGFTVSIFDAYGRPAVGGSVVMTYADQSFNTLKTETLNFTPADKGSKFVSFRVATNNYPLQILTNTGEQATIFSFGGLFVNTFADTAPGTPATGGTLSLRQAIEAANAVPGRKFIGLGQGTYNLTNGPIRISTEMTLQGYFDDNLTTGTIVNGNGQQLFSIASNGSVVMDHVELKNGFASTGGAVENNGTLVITSSTLDNNRATNAGGAIWNAGTLTLNRTTVANNRTTFTTGTGGAIYNQGTLSLDAVTISLNTSATGGGIFNQGTSFLTAVNTIVAGNTATTAAPDLSTSTLSDQGFNFFGNTAGITATLKSTDVVNKQALLGPLQINGLFPPTMVPQPGSPAVDAGTAGSSDLVDERGATRAVGTATDIGAAEVQLGGPIAAVNFSSVPAVTAKGATFNIGVQAVDAYGHPATGTVTFRTSDAASLSPTTLNFSENNPFPTIVPVTLNTPGYQAVRGVWTLNGASTSSQSTAIQVYSTLLVNTLADVVNPNDTLLSFREAVTQALASPTPINVSFAVTGTTFLNSPIAIPSGANLKIDGTGVTIAVLGRSNRTFTIASGATVAMTNVSLLGDYLGSFGQTLGGGIENRGNLTLTSSSLSNINFQGNAAALYNAGTLTADGTAFRANRAQGAGGAVFNEGGAAVFRNATVFADNSANLGVGGALFISGGRVDIGAGAIFSGNSTSYRGGAILARNATLNIDGSTFTNNSTYADGGAIAVETVSGGSSSATLTNDVFSGNRANSSNGGSIFNDAGAVLNIVNSTIKSSNAGVSGGGIYNKGTAKVAKSTLNANVSTSYDGGAIYNAAGSMTISQSTFTANTANGYGGAIATAAELKLTADTIVANQSGVGAGGVHRFATATGIVTVGQTIIAKNTRTYNFSPDVFGGFSSTGYNFIGVVNSTTSGWLPSGTGADLVGNDATPLDPKLRALADNGGPTLTMYPDAGSPIINAGPATFAESTDQRGLPRINGPAMDLGAVEDPPGDPTPSFIITGSVVNWTGAVDDQWSNPGNWDTNQVPGPDDNVNIDAAGTTIVYPGGDTTINALVSNASIQVHAGSITLRRGGGETSGSIIVSAGASMTFAGGSFVFDADSQGIGGAGDVYIAGSGSVEDRADYAIRGLTDIRDGRLILSGNIESGFKVEDAGILELAASDGMLDEVDYVTGSGFVEVDPGTTVTVTGTYAVSGLTDVRGTLVLQGGDGGLGGGDLQVENGGTLRFASGVYSYVPGSTLSGGGAVDIRDGHVTFGGMSTLSGTMSIEGGLVTFCCGNPFELGGLDVSGGTIDGTDDLTILTSGSWTGGTISGTGAFVVKGDFAIGADHVDLNLDGRTLTNEGKILFSGLGSTLSLNNGASIVNASAGTFDLHDAVDVRLGSSPLGGEHFENLGLLMSDAETGVAELDVPLHNVGTVQVMMGEMRLNSGDGGSSPGSFIVDDMGMLTLASADFHFVAGSSIGGPGMMQIEGSNVVVDGDYSVGGCVEVMSGSLTFNRGFSGGSSFAIDAAGSLTFNPGTYVLSSTSDLESSGRLTIAGADVDTSGIFISTDRVHLDGGSLTLRGTTGGVFDIASGASLSMVGPNLRLLPDTAFTGAGSLTSDAADAVVTGPYTVTGTTEVVGGSLTLSGGDAGTPGRFVVESGGTLVFDADPYAPDSIAVRGGGLVLNGGATVEPASLSVTNGGSVDVLWGVLTLDQVSGGGSYTVGLGSTMIFTTDTALDPSSSIGGLGGVTIEGATLTDPGVYGLTGHTTISDGSLILSGGDGGASGGFDIGGGSTLTFDGGRYILDPAATVTGTGRLIVDGGSFVDVQGPFTLDGEVDVLDGTLSLDDGDFGGQIHAVFTVAADGLLVFGGGKFDMVSENVTGDGHILVTGGSIVVIDGIYRIASTEVRDGTLSLMLGDGGSSGAFHVGDAGALEFHYGSFDTSAKGIDGTGSVVVNGATVAFGSSDHVGSLTVVNGVANFSGTETTALHRLTMTGGTLTGTGVVQVTGEARWSGGTMSGVGSTEIVGALAIDGDGAVLDGRMLINRGATRMTSDGAKLAVLGGSTIRNMVGATWDFQASASIVPAQKATGSEAFINEGTVIRSGAGDTATIDVAFRNTGLVETRAHTLEFQGSLDTRSGVIRTLPGGFTEVLGALTLGTDGGFEGAGSSVVLTPLNAVGDPETSYVIALYQDLLNRAPDGVGLTLRHRALVANGDRSAVVSAIIASPEYRSFQVDAIFAQYLHRLPTSAETVKYSATLATQTPDAIAVGLIGSREYFTSVARGSNAGFLAALYLDVLGRPIDAPAAKTYLARLTRGASRTVIAREVVNGLEHLAQAANGVYLKYLHRDADPAGLQNAVAYLQSHRPEELIATLLTSNEYVNGYAGYVRHANAPFLTAMNDALLHGTDGRFASAFESLLDQGRTRVAVALEMINGPTFRTALVNGLSRFLLGKPAAPDALAKFVSELNAGATDEQIASEIIGSSRFFELAGRSNDRFVTLLYENVLHREPTKQERARLVSALNHGTSRQAAALRLLTSREAIAGLVTNLSPTPLEPAQVATYVDIIKKYKVTDEAILAFVATGTPIPSDIGSLTAVFEAPKGKVTVAAKPAAATVSVAPRSVAAKHPSGPFKAAARR